MLSSAGQAAQSHPHEADHDERGADHRDPSSKPVGQEDIAYRAMLRAKSLGQIGQGAALAVPEEDKALDENGHNGRFCQPRVAAGQARVEDAQDTRAHTCEDQGVGRLDQDDGCVATLRAGWRRCNRRCRRVSLVGSGGHAISPVATEWGEARPCSISVRLLRRRIAARCAEQATTRGMEAMLHVHSSRRGLREG
jgi:hypothetical protein